MNMEQPISTESILSSEQEDEQSETETPEKLDEKWISEWFSEWISSNLKLSMKDISIFSLSNFPNLFVDFIAKKDIKKLSKK